MRICPRGYLSRGIYPGGIIMLRRVYMSEGLSDGRGEGEGGGVECRRIHFHGVSVQAAREDALPYCDKPSSSSCFKTKKGSA